MRYEVATAGRIVVGPGSASELPGLAAEIGSCALLVHGQGTLTRGGPAADLIHLLAARGLVGATYMVGGEPDVGAIERAASLAREAKCDMAIGIGGGSVLDTAKAAAALAANSGSALTYMEVVGAGKALEHPALPIIAVPTTAGTGSEVTRNAVVAAPAQQVKASIRHPSLLPRLALVDSVLTHDLPPSVTAGSGLDALTQLIEPYVSRRAQPFTDGLCLEGLARAAWALRRVFHVPGDAAAREAMATASVFSGIALANAGLGAIHGIAAPLCGAYPAPHGAACAALLPHGVAANIRALRRRDASHPALARYGRVAEIVLERAGASPDDLVRWLNDIVAELEIAPLRSYGLVIEQIPALAAQAARASSTRANPLDLEESELAEAIEAAL
jgi:alcohol dehydrogenase class IV